MKGLSISGLPRNPRPLPKYSYEFTVSRCYMRLLTGEWCIRKFEKKKFRALGNANIVLKANKILSCSDQGLVVISVPRKDLIRVKYLTFNAKSTAKVVLTVDYVTGKNPTQRS